MEINLSPRYVENKAELCPVAEGRGLCYCLTLLFSLFNTLNFRVATEDERKRLKQAIWTPIELLVNFTP